MAHNRAMTNYRRRVTAAVTFARQDPTYQGYVRRWGPTSLAASVYLSDRWGTWVAHDARKAMGHTFR